MSIDDWDASSLPTSQLETLIASGHSNHSMLTKAREELSRRAEDKSAKAVEAANAVAEARYTALVNEVKNAGKVHWTQTPSFWISFVGFIVSTAISVYALKIALRSLELQQSPPQVQPLAATALQPAPAPASASIQPASSSSDSRLMPQQKPAPELLSPPHAEPAIASRSSGNHHVKRPAASQAGAQ